MASFLSRLFSKKTKCEDDIRYLAGSILVSSVALQNDINNKLADAALGTRDFTVEFVCIALHYISRVALHIGGPDFQDMVYDKVCDLVVASISCPLSEADGISEPEAGSRLAEMIKKREFEYAGFTTAYTEAQSMEDTLFGRAAKNIAKASDLGHDNVIRTTGNSLVMWAATAKLEDQLHKIKAACS